ncbi:alpha/beta hydrolase-fold protein [Shewanella waksmanii]|uniref:alpha/beta hydrolase-fold protein n=1 Tax=Shewanella waksmanii TaxID=213783 RepID=UPI00048E3788|nr:alpha/beta hydrolase-fold protein [Shewanella waksmanii]
MKNIALIGLLLGLLYGLLAFPCMAAPVDEKSSIAVSRPLISGQVFSHHSSAFDYTRRVMISLPERYHLHEKRRYPVLYVVDADFQFQHVSAIALHLARMGKIAPMIVVGVANQGDSDYLYSTTWPVEGEQDFGGAQRFQQYLSEELLPLINQQYRTNQQQALAGYSLGGLFSLYSMMQAKTPFNAFLAMSPSVWVDNYALPSLIEPLLKQDKLTGPLFVSVANEQDMGVDKLVAKLNAIPNQLQWQFKQYPQENHFTTALPALYDGLQFLAPNYGELSDGSDLVAMGDYKVVLNRFKQQQSHWAGFEIEWLHAYQFAKYLSWSKQYDSALEALALARKLFPQSATTLCIELAKGALIRKQQPLATQLLDSCQAQGQSRPFWHLQRGKLYQAAGDADLAKQHIQQAKTLAKQYQLASWEIWELAK